MSRVIERVTQPTLDILELLLQGHHQDVELHGWLIAERIERPRPTVYRALGRLEAGGWATSTWATPEAGRPPRRAYRLTPEGAEGAAALLGQRRASARG
jgi:PadR family transcriptional regulator, regulatory protein PadR